MLILAGHDVLSLPLSSRPSRMCLDTAPHSLLEFVVAVGHVIEEGAQLSHILYVCTYIYTYNTSLPIRLFSSRGTPFTGIYDLWKRPNGFSLILPSLSTLFSLTASLSLSV